VQIAYDVGRRRGAVGVTVWGRDDPETAPPEVPIWCDKPGLEGVGSGATFGARALHLVNQRIAKRRMIVASAETFKVSASGQMSLPAAARHRWHLDGGGVVDVIDLGFGVLTLPAGEAGRLLDRILPAEAHYAAVAAEDDPDLINT